MQTDVFRKLQLKLSLSILLVQAIVLLVLLGSLNLYLHASNLQGCYAFIEDLVQGDGIVQRKNTLEKTSSDSGAEGSDFYNEGRLPAKKASGSSTDDGSFRLSTVSLLGKFYPFKTEFSSSRDFYTARV
ncbi:MAG: hypothetical protein II110_04540, partial [Treponema sp.]|nr:hypothetical protein [Treponema sp.]